MVFGSCQCDVLLTAVAAPCISLHILQLMCCPLAGAASERGATTAAAVQAHPWCLRLACARCSRGEARSQAGWLFMWAWLLHGRIVMRKQAVPKGKQHRAAVDCLPLWPPQPYMLIKCPQQAHVLLAMQAVLLLPLTGFWPRNAAWAKPPEGVPPPPPPVPVAQRAQARQARAYLPLRCTTNMAIACRCTSR